MKRRRVPLLAASFLLALPVAAAADDPDRPSWTVSNGAPGIYELDTRSLEQELARAPVELTDKAREVEAVVALPRPDGKLARFRVEESPILSAALTEKYGIRTYTVRGLDDPAAVGRLDLGPLGLHALVLAPSGSFEIRPDREQPDRYRSLRYDDDPLREATRCVAQDLDKILPPAVTGEWSVRATAGTLSIYYLAVSATGEFTAQNGGTVASALAAIMTVINGVNAIYRRDFGVHLALVEGTDQAILTEPSAYLESGDLTCGDGPGTCLQPDCLLTANQCVLDGLIGNANYDVGVVFDAAAADGSAAGRAELYAVCDVSKKGRGATGGTSVELAAHEIGHMFGGHHTFNDGATGTCSGQRDAAWAYEPGSGSTIMSYAGTCDAADLQKSRDLAFHSDNVREVLGFTQSGNALSCSTQAVTGNYGPIVLTPPGDHTVPKQTPFRLEVEAYDPNSDTVTYSFEQSEVGPASPPETDDGMRPIARAYLPSVNPWRSFPREQYVLYNANTPPATFTCGTATCLTGEVLPSVARTMDWYVILRDNVDAVTFSGGVVTIDGSSGPFQVTQPVTGNAWTEGTRKTITWNVAGTNAGAVDCASVRILLSTDDGATWPQVLAGSTPNDGSELVTLPFGTSSTSRIKVEAVGNIFYDVSDAFTIRKLAVTNTNDSGPGSLRQALFDANDYPNGATIPLFIPGGIGNVRTIQVLSQLPAVTKQITIDAWELGGPDYTGPPLLELVGAGCADVAFGVPCDGLTIQAGYAFLNGLVVRSFPGHGIVLRGATAHSGVVQNSYIGTDVTGTVAAGNGRSGILIEGGFDNPSLAHVLFANVISGNHVGVTITGAGANGTLLERNKIGTNAAGTARIPNLEDGVRIVGAPNTLIGTAGLGNLISGNGTLLSGFVHYYADAIDISGAGASGTVIQGNIIGLDATGASPLFNTNGAIRVAHVPNTRIGGLTAATRNVIGDDGTVNYHFAHCISVTGAGAAGTIVEGNYLGTDATGTLDRGCRGAGVYIDAAPGVRIGGTTAAARNVISGNNDYGGVWITNGATGTLIQGNHIGTDVTGTVAIPNNPYGIELQSGGNTIGGTAAGARNVISGNTQRGIDLNENGASNNVIQGNYIGTNAAGTAALGNGTYGINLLRSPNNLIGGTVTGARNVISGNGAHGIYIAGSDGLRAPGNLIQGNYIGTDAAGSAGLGNGTGIELYYVTDVAVGGSAAGAGNVISAARNGAPGIVIYSSGLTTSGIVVQGNRIGTNAAGTAALGNTGEGIWASITGTASILDNVIGGSGINGISLSQGSFTVQGNFVGTDASGTIDLRNARSGIATTSTAACLIGGTALGQGNVIAFNALPPSGINYAGIQIQGGASGQTVRGNRIFSNTGLGIDLHALGAGPNDPCDPDTGANGMQNFPLLSAVHQSGSATHIVGTLDSTASTAFTLDFYASSSCDALGYGEGATYLGSTAVTTSGSCSGSFDLLLPSPSSGVITATATDPAGNTSEFSPCTAVAPSPVADVPGLAWASKSQLTWSAAAGATSYRVLRGAPLGLPDLLDVDVDSCTRFTGAALTTGAVLTELPSVNTFYWYLVVGTNGVEDGPAGAATEGARIANESGTCP